MNPVIVITDKVMRMIRSMVYMAMKVQPGSSVSPDEISHFINQRSSRNRFHAGVVELALQDLHRDGVVQRSGARWQLSGTRA
jgi:hypothetical protein